MKTITDETNGSEKSTPAGMRWYRVHPVLLALLAAEVVALTGLIAFKPDVVLYCLSRAVSALQIGFVEVELVLICLASLAVSAAVIHGRREAGMHFDRILRRSEKRSVLGH